MSTAVASAYFVVASSSRPTSDFSLSIPGWSAGVAAWNVEARPRSVLMTARSRNTSTDPAEGLWSTFMTSPMSSGGEQTGIRVRAKFYPIAF